jgi:hypothetical protein
VWRERHGLSLSLDLDLARQQLAKLLPAFFENRRLHVLPVHLHDVISDQDRSDSTSDFEALKSRQGQAEASSTDFASSSRATPAKNCYFGEGSAPI